MSIATFPAPSLQAQLNELRRERGMRDRVYPHWIATGKIKQTIADHSNLGLDGAIKTLETLVAAEGQPGRKELTAGFRELMAAYVRLLETGRDRIIDLGGTCDAVEVMKAGDPALVAARALLERIPA